MGLTWNIVDRSEYFLNRVSEGSMQAMEYAGEIMVQNVRDQMVNGYGEVHPHAVTGGASSQIYDTGRLYNSITAETEQQAAYIVQVSVGTDVEYAKYVHEGTYKLNGRPFIKDGVEKCQGQIEMIVADLLREALS